MDWFVVYTTPRAEKKVAKRIAACACEVFLPLLKEKRLWSDRVRVVEQPMFASYVFVRADARRLREFLTIDGVVRMVYCDGEPAVVRENEIVQIRKFAEQAENGTIETGDRVEILCGGLKTVTGKVQKIGKTHLYLYLEQLGASVCVHKDSVQKRNNKIESRQTRLKIKNCRELRD